MYPGFEREFAVESEAIHITGRIIGNEMMVKRELFPPDLDVIAARMVVEDDIANPPANALTMNGITALTAIFRKKINRGIVIS